MYWHFIDRALTLAFDLFQGKYSCIGGGVHNSQNLLVTPWNLQNSMHDIQKKNKEERNHYVSAAEAIHLHHLTQNIHNSNYDVQYRLR